MVAHQPGLTTALVADNSGVECTANHPGSRGVADIVSVTMPFSSIKHLAVAVSTRAGPAEDDPPLYKLGSKLVQAVCKERMELLIELFWGGVRAENIWQETA